MGSTQQFCLKWNNHQSNMLSIFDQLLSSEHFVDVTLACDGLSVRAHKMVLSACSPFFQSLFIQNPCKHPIVILKDIRFVDLKALVQFMYRGEVNVSQDQLPTLLKAAETLKIKGLAEVTNDNQSKPSLPLGLSQNNGHHPSVPTGNSLSKPDCQQPSVQAAVTVPPTANTVAQSALVAAMQQQQQNALKAQLQAAQTAAAQHQAAQQAAAAAHESTNSNASTPLRQTDSPMSQPNRKRRRKSGSEKGSGDEGSGAESAADDMDDTRASDDESAGEEVEFEPSKLLEQSMTEVRGNQDNNSSSSEQTKDGSQPDIKPVINFDSANAGALASLNPGDPTAVLAFAAAAQAAGAASGDSVAGPSQPTHGDVVPTGPLTPATPAGMQLMCINKLDTPTSWPCAYCTVVVGSRSALNRHISNIHSPFRTTFTCHLCNAAVSRKDHLWRHIRRKHPDAMPPDMPTTARPGGTGDCDSKDSSRSGSGLVLGSPPPPSIQLQNQSCSSSPPHAIILKPAIELSLPSQMVVTSQTSSAMP